MRNPFDHLGLRLSEVGFYITLDVVTAALTYIISYGEAGLTDGKLMMRMLGAMMLANGLVGGPDGMLYWKESGRRIEAERERDAVAKERDAAVQERDALREEIRELRAMVEQLQNERGGRVARRRRLRNNGQ